MTAFFAAFQALLSLLASGGHRRAFVRTHKGTGYRPQDDGCIIETDRSMCTTDPGPAEKVREMFMRTSGLTAQAPDLFSFSGSLGPRGSNVTHCGVLLLCRTQKDYIHFSSASITDVSTPTGCEIEHAGLSVPAGATAEQADRACGPFFEDVLRSGDWRGMDVARFGVDLMEGDCGYPPEWQVVVKHRPDRGQYNATLERVLAREVDRTVSYKEMPEPYVSVRCMPFR
jgi:hypothetical protein